MITKKGLEKRIDELKKDILNDVVDTESDTYVDIKLSGNTNIEVNVQEDKNTKTYYNNLERKITAYKRAVAHLSRLNNNK
jgi:hypothetical protein